MYFNPIPKPTPRKKRRRARERDRITMRRECREAVVAREGYRSRLTRRPLNLSTGEVHEIRRRSVGGSPFDTKNCIALLPGEHIFFTLNYIDAELLTAAGADGPIRWTLLPAGEKLLRSGPRLDRKAFGEIWATRTREDL